MTEITDRPHYGEMCGNKRNWNCLPCKKRFRLTIRSMVNNCCTKTLNVALC